jgi:hypothetical protein
MKGKPLLHRKDKKRVIRAREKKQKKENQKKLKIKNQKEEQKEDKFTKNNIKRKAYKGTYGLDEKYDAI